MPSQWGMKGGAELMTMIDRVPQRLGRAIGRGGMRAGARVVAEEAKLRVGTEKIAKEIKVSSRASGTVVSAKVYVREGKHSYGFVAWWLEYGVAPHWIRPVRKGGLDLGEFGGEEVIRGLVHHPGFGAQPFLVPSLDAKAVDAINAIGSYVGSRLAWDGLKGPEVAVEEDEE